MENNIVTNLLDRYGWTWKTTSEGKIVTGFQGMSGDFLLGFDVKDDWLVIFTIEYLPKTKVQNEKELYSALLRFNLKYPYTRFAMTAEEDIIILADVVINQNKKVNFDVFQLAMDLICEVADSFYPILYEHVTGEKLALPGEEAT